MEQDLNYVKMIVRSVLTSTPGNVTIAQLIKDYENLEGTFLPYSQLGFKSVYGLLKAMNDIFTIPNNPNMNSPIKLIVDEKTSHIRNLVINQRSKQSHSKKKCLNRNRNSFKYSYSAYDNYASVDNRNFRDYNAYESNNYRKYDFKARGYDYVKHKSFNLENSKGIVTDELRKYIENLCINSEFISVSTLKCHLINHPDYDKLNTTNIEDAINMLKYFLYIDRGCIYLIDPPCEMLPINKSKASYDERPTLIKSLQNVIDEDEAIELMNDDVVFDDDDDDDDNNASIENTYKSNLINKHLNISDIFKPIKKNELQETHTTLYNNKDRPFKHKNVNPKIELKVPSADLVEKDINYYKSVICSIITNSSQPITVSQVLCKFKSIYGYVFPFQKLSCRTCMDFFRLYSTLFKLSDQYSTNSVITLEEQIVDKRKTTNRHKFIHANIFNNDHIYNNSEEFQLLQKGKYFASISKKSNIQPLTDCIDKIDINCKKSNSSLEIYDSDAILQSTKEKMRAILTKFNNGIPCNEFMGIYENEYHSSFTFTEYGFTSMKDMAFKLPSVFYVKITENNECILYNAQRRNDLKNNSDDPLEYHKNIPKTVLHNLSILFNNHNHGIPLNGLMKLYCVEFGRSYEPLKYGYSSERHMFESLNKMVEIRNNILYTIDPFAYTDFLENKDDIHINKESLPILGVNKILMNYSGNDVCNGQFVYHNFRYMNEKSLEVVIGEIYSSNSFYIQRYSAVNMLNKFMADLQEFYDKNENYYTVLPEVLTLGLACTSRFEDTKQWHRAKILKMIGESSVQLLYVDYGSIEVVLKSNIRLLDKKFGNLPIQSLHCTLKESDQLTNLSREMNEYFADMVDNKKLEALFHKQKSKTINDKKPVTLYFQRNTSRVNLNKEFLNEIKGITQNQETIRRTILKLDEFTDSDELNESDEISD